MAPAPPSTIVPVLVMSVVAWRVVRRVRKNIGRQPVQTKRMIARIVMFALGLVVIGMVSSFNTQGTMGLAGGLAAGVLLAFVGLHLTKFENTPQGHFYTPNTYIGIGLSVLLVFRLVYRTVRVYMLHGTADLKSSSLTQGGLTLFLFGLVAGYYIAYFAGVLVKAHGVGKR